MAALSLGKWKKYNSAYRSMGYRFYNIFPDDGLFTPKFWEGFYLREKVDG